MKTILIPAVALAFVVPCPVAAQHQDLSRQAYSFIDNRLDVVVLADGPGVLQVVRGDYGRIDVASRARDGLAGSALGGIHTRQLRLTAAGAEGVEYIVAVPEYVSVRVQLPDGLAASLSPSTAAASYRWASTVQEPGTEASSATPRSEFTTVLTQPRAPTVVDVPDLSAVRSLAVRAEGSEFRVAASRPLQLGAAGAGRLEIRPQGEPMDVVVYVPVGTSAFTLRSGTRALAEATDGRFRPLCGNVVVQRPAPQQIWLSFHPQRGQLDCR
jgi:hypothetical protein